METNVDTRQDFVSWTSDIGKFGYLKFSAQSMAAWLFVLSLNTFVTDKDRDIAPLQQQTVCGQQNVHVFLTC